MRYLITVLIVLTLATLLTACGHSETELGNQLGCHLAGNGCNSQGPAGAPGLPGLIGPAGPGGVNGTSFTFVKLCPGVTSYPNVFVELAMCVNGDLYGVYSANNGFLTYFPPGNYQSHAIGSACNLTVLPNCQVRN